MARLDALRAAVPDVESAADERDFDRAQQAVKQALEAIHELEDSREENDGNKRNEWSSAQWTADELGLWRAHVGARNAAHHFSSHVVHVVGGSNRAASRDDLRWEDELPMINSTSMASEYRDRLGGHAVLPTFDAITALLVRSIC